MGPSVMERNPQASRKNVFKRNSHRYKEDATTKITETLTVTERIAGVKQQ
jgi:hypothetical protein